MSRDLFLLAPEFRQAIGRVLATCEELGVEMRPCSTVRDPRQQARFWRQSRPIEEIMAAIRKLERNGAPFLAHLLHSVGPQNGPWVTNALPGLSWHQWGEAVDCYWHLNDAAEWSTRKKVSINDGREVNGYRLYAELAQSNGLTAGGFWEDLQDWSHVQKRPSLVQSHYSWPEIDEEMRRRFGETEPGDAQPATAAPAPVTPVGRKFVQVKDGQFIVDQKPFKFIGFNTRALLHYGAEYTHGPGYENRSMTYTDDQVQQAQIEMAYGFGARVLRVFLAHKNASADDIIDRLEQLLSLIRDTLGYKDLYLIPALTNFYSDVDFYVRGDNGEFGGGSHYQDTLAPAWFRPNQDGYQKYYLPFVEKVVRHFKDNPGIFAWEVGNELKVETDPRLLIGFMHHMARVIREQDPNHLVTTGMISTCHTAMDWQQHRDLRKRLYEAPRDLANGDQRPMFDFVTIHYPREANFISGNWNCRDADLAKNELKMPFIIEEDLVLKQQCHDRAQCFKRHLEEWLGAGNDVGRGASGYMVWGFDGANVPDGHPGGIGGRQAPPDWQPLRNLFSTYAEDLAQRVG